MTDSPVSEIPSPNIPSRPPSANLNLESLPKETLAEIIKHIDGPTAVSLALAAKSFTAISEPAIWRKINLALNPSYGLSPLIRPIKEGTNENYPGEEDSWWWTLQVAAADPSCRMASETKVKAVNANGDKGNRWLAVRELTMDHRLTAVNDFAYTLEHTRNLRKLKIIAPVIPACRDDMGFPWYFLPDSLDHAIARSGIDFPFLTHLHLGKNSLQYAETLIQFCNCAPNLIHLDLDLDQLFPWMSQLHVSIPAPNDHDHSDLGRERRISVEHIRPDFHYVMSSTKIKTLILRFDNDEFEDECLTDDCDADSTVMQLLKSTPLLDRLSITFDEYNGEHGIYGRIFPIINDFQHLEDLHCQGSTGSFMGTNMLGMLDDAEWEYEGLRRLSLLVTTLAPELSDWDPPASIQVLHYIFGSPIDDFRPPTVIIRNPGAVPVDQPGSKSLHETLQRNILATPRLRHFHCSLGKYETPGSEVLDQMDKIEEGGSNGIIRSFCYGGEELLHVRFKRDYVEVSDGLDENRGEVVSKSGVLYVPYRVGDEGRVKGYEFYEEARWMDFTSGGCGAVPVPLEVFEKMRIVEGLSEDECDARGVQVGDEAWSVYLKWKDEAERQ